MTSFFSAASSFRGPDARLGDFARPSTPDASDAPAASAAERKRLVSVSNRFGSVVEGAPELWAAQIAPMEVEPGSVASSPQISSGGRTPRRKWTSLISRKDEPAVAKQSPWRARVGGCLMVLVLILVTYTVLCHIVGPNFEIFRRLGEAGHDNSDPANADLVLLVLGDWGGMRFWPYTTPGQRAVAAAMRGVVRDAGHRRAVVLSLGDNFYNAGVSDISSHRFQRTFHDVYIAGQAELGADDSWKVIAGNHDWRKDVGAQIAYTNESRPWHFPAEYYTFFESLPLPSGGSVSVQFVMLDTMILCANDGHGKCNQGEEFEPRKEVQFAWIESTLAASRADYLIVGGHHPVHSMGSHGSTPALVERLEPMLLRHGATMYLSGHDHCHQAARMGELDYHGVGGGAGLKYYGKRSLPSGVDGVFYYSGGVWPSNPFDGSFASITISAQKIAVTHRNSQGEAFLTLSRPPRSMRIVS